MRFNVPAYTFMHDAEDKEMWNTVFAELHAGEHQVWDFKNAKILGGSYWIGVLMTLYEEFDTDHLGALISFENEAHVKGQLIERRNAARRYLEERKEDELLSVGTTLGVSTDRVVEGLDGLQSLLGAENIPPIPGA